MEGMKDRLSIWVFEALKSRRSTISSDKVLDWKLIKFNSRPKVMSIQPMMLPDTPLHHIMIVYRLDTKQRLAMVTRGQKEAQTIDRDVIDYIAFIFDTSKDPSDVVVAGSLFESK